MTSTVGGAQYAVAASGTLVYVPSEPEQRRRDLVRHADGVTTPIGFEPREYQNIALSPDGSLVATTIYGEGASDLWLGDLARGTLTRLTSDGASIDPVWTPDGRFILFGWLEGGRIHMRRIAPNAAGPPETIAATTDATPLSMAPDGSILGQRLHPTRAMDLVLVDPETREARDWLATPASEVRGRISPDGRWVVFDSDRSGRREVYLRPFRDPSGAEWQVSPSGGRDAHWHPDGRRIVYTRGAELYQVPIAPDGRLGVASRLGGARGLIQLRAGADGGVFAIQRTHEEQPVAAFRVVSGWQHEVRARLGR
jgi:Tol biopolymer transport system component